LLKQKPVVVKGGYENDFKVTAEQVEKSDHAKNKKRLFFLPLAILPVSVFSKKELEDISRVVLKHPNLMVIADEIYEHINFTGDQTSMGFFAGNA